MLESKRVLRATALVLLLLATAASAIVLGPLGIAQRFYRLVAFQPALARDSGSLVASLWCWQLDVVVSGLLGVAFAGVAVSVRDAYQAHRHMEHSWLYGVVTALATNDERIYRVFALLGYAHSMKVAVEVADSVAKRLLTQWGTMILEVQRG